MFSIANLVYGLPHKLPNDLRLRILENKEMLGKSQIWVETQPSAQSLFQKFGSSSQKTCKSRYQTFFALSSLAGFLYFVPNILPRIVATSQLASFSLFQLSSVLLFSLPYFKTISSRIDHLHTYKRLELSALPLYSNFILIKFQITTVTGGDAEIHRNSVELNFAAGNYCLHRKLAAVEISLWSI